MPPKSGKEPAPLMLICGEEDLSVKRRAKEVFASWSAEVGGMDHETIDAAASNSGDALRCLGQLREAINTLPFFGTGKVVWFQNCNFLAEERHATAAVAEELAILAQDLKEFQWQSVRLLISAGKVDRRKAFYKTIDKLGRVELFEPLSTDDKDWQIRAEEVVRNVVAARNKKIGEDALVELVARVGPDIRQLEAESEKLLLYTADRQLIALDDVLAISTTNKAARAFALGDALGDRDVPRLLKRLDEELWEVKLDPQKSEIGLLYGLISKVRALLLLHEMIQEGWIKPNTDYPRFKLQIEKIPAEAVPSDRKFNPLAINPYILYKALPQVKLFSQAELVRAMELLLECNRKLVSSSVEEAMVLQTTLLQIAAGGAAKGQKAPVRP